MVSDIKLNGNGVLVEGTDITFDRGAEQSSIALNLKNPKGFWHISGPRSYEPNNPLSIFWHNNTQFSGPFLSITTNGSVGIGTNNPVRSLHVEGNEIHSSGGGAGFSFSDRAKPAFVDKPQNGERWIWYAFEGKARLWSGRDILIISEDGRRDGGLPELRIDGDLHIGGKISGGHVSRLDGVQITPDAPDLKPVKRIKIYADTIAFDGSSGKPEKYGLHTDFENDKEVLVLNFPPNRYGKSFKDGVRVEGNLQVNGVVTQASSITLKENVAELSGQEAMTALQGLHAVKFNYKADSQKEQRIGFIAEEVPGLVASADRDRLSSMDIVAVLTKAMQEQQRMLAELTAEVSALRGDAGSTHAVNARVQLD